jgi:hypothetical protein
MPRYQEGGLAVLTGADPDEREDPSIVEAPGALEEVSGRQPAHLPIQSSRAGKEMTTTDAMKRLDVARQRLVDRRDKIEADKTDQWLALAEGMLAPTQTGGFGESLGAAAGLVGKARSAKRKSLTEIEKDLLDAEVKQQTLLQQSRARLGGHSKVYHPDDQVAYPDDPTKWRHIEKQTIVHSDGTTEHIFTGTEDGRILEVVSNLNPTVVSEAAAAKKAAGDAQILRSHEITTGLNSTLAVNKLQRAREIFEGITTSGIKGKFIDFAQFLNIDLDENADFQLARRLMGAEVLNQLTLLTGTKTDFEYKKIEELNASTAKGKEANLAIIDDMLTRYENMIKFGEDAAFKRAKELGGNPDDDLSVKRFRNFRNDQSAREEMKQVQRESGIREPDPAFEARLIETWEVGGRNEQLIEAYKRRGFNWPPTDPNTVSELRKKGAEI